MSTAFSLLWPSPPIPTIATDLGCDDGDETSSTVQATMHNIATPISAHRLAIFPGGPRGGGAPVLVLPYICTIVALGKLSS